MESALWLPFRGPELLVRLDGTAVALLSQEAWAGLAADTAGTAHAVGELGGLVCYAVDLPADWQPPEPMAFHNLRRLWGALPEEAWRLAGRGVQIVDWDRNHRFCGRCGTATARQPGEWSRQCPSCGLAHFPRLSPAVIVRIERGDEILLARSPHFQPGVYSTLAGFVEPGESLEEAVHREIFEEVGVRVAHVRYFGSQPWPFPNSLMVGFVAEYLSGELRLQEGEIEDARWFTRDTLPNLPFAISIARALIEEWIERGAGARTPPAGR
jgi:NAD+ diphosphatase